MLKLDIIKPNLLQNLHSFNVIKDLISYLTHKIKKKTYFWKFRAMENISRLPLDVFFPGQPGKIAAPGCPA